MAGFHQSQLQVQTTVIDFNEIGGAPGTYGTGLFFPASASVYGSVFNVFRNFTSGGAATVSMGYRSIDLAAPVALATEFANAVPFAGLIVGPSFPAVQTFLSNGVAGGPFAWELTFTIGVAALTDFLIIPSMAYILLDL